MPIYVVPNSNDAGVNDGYAGMLWFEDRAAMGAYAGAAAHERGAWCAETDSAYEFSPADAGTPNEWTIIAGIGGNWLLTGNVICLGNAIGDGVTDDRQTIQDAFDAVGQNGGKVFFPIGRYKCVGGLTINVADRPIEIFGAGQGEQLHGTPGGSGSVIVWAGGDAAPLLAISGGATQVHIHDLAFDNTNDGGSLATHGIKAIDSSQLLIERVLMFPDTGLAFSIAGIELGANEHPILKGSIVDTYVRNCAVGTLISAVIHCALTKVTHIDCGICSQAGIANATAYSLDYFACTFEARGSQTGARVVRGNAVNYYGCQFDSFDTQVNQTGFGLEILSDAALADSVNLYGGRFTGDTVGYGAKIDFGSATIKFDGVYFSGMTGAGVKNKTNRLLTFIGCHNEDVGIPIVDSVVNGTVYMMANDVAGTGIVADRLGAPVGALYAQGMVDEDVPDPNAFALSGSGRDGVVYVQGNIAVLNNQTTKSENGPYLVGKDNGGGAAPLTRIPAWKVDAAIPSGLEIKLSNLGTDYGGLTLQATATGLIGTNDPVLLFKEIMCNVKAAGGVPNGYNAAKGFSSVAGVEKPGGAGGYKVFAPPVGVDFTRMTYGSQPIGAANTSNMATITINPTDFRYIFAVGAVPTDMNHTLYMRLIP